MIPGKSRRQLTTNSVVTENQLRSLAVVGSGQMGTGIAISMARKMIGLERGQPPPPSVENVMVLDVCKQQLKKSQNFVEKWIQKEIEKRRMTDTDGKLMFGKLKFLQTMTTSPSPSTSDTTNSRIPWSSIDFVVEAASEVFSVKQNIFQHLNDQTRPDVILATNTSSISITKIAACTTKPENVIGMHFMNPVPVMPLVEIIMGLSTSPACLQVTQQLARAMGKITAESLDRPGFVSNRVLMPYINEAVYTLQEGIATAQDIDTIMKLGTNVPMGPLTLADFIGLDTCLAVMRVLHNELGDSKYRPAPLLAQHVDAGWLGKKTGRGFYKYDR